MHGRSRSSRAAVGLALIAMLLATRGASAAAAVAYWGQAQAHLETFNGAPLLAANWKGRFRPFVFENGAYVALMPRDDGATARLDLYSPLALSATEILLAGSDAGRPAYDLYRYDTRTRALTNLTVSDRIDEGRTCVYPPDRLLAYRAAGEERIARVREELSPLAHARLPPFEQCRWLDGRTLLGVERAGVEYRLHRCTLGEGDAVSCTTSTLAGVDTVAGFVDAASSPGVIARRRPDLFRGAFLLADSSGTLTPAPIGTDVLGDVLAVDGPAVRSGFHGRYVSSLAAASAATVYVTRRIGAATFAIVATERGPRTLARLGAGDWEPIVYPGIVVPADAPAAREIWMRSPAGELYQAFYFGAAAPRRVVVWWHGGPNESVSPRFNPYFQALNERGYGVLAVNYPGSTGRGTEYEGRFGERWLVDCVQAVWSYLRDNGVPVVVSWSVSSGNVVQAVVLGHNLPVSAIVDQAGWGRTSLLTDAARRRVPFFAIRGRNDPAGPIARVDFSYPDGHDIVSADDFSGLFAAVTTVLDRAVPVRYPAGVPPPTLRVLLDTPAAGGDVAADEHALAFELATHVVHECFAPGEVGFTQNATAALFAPAADRARPAHSRRTPAATDVPRVLLRVRPGGGDAPSGADAGAVVQPIDVGSPAERERLRSAEVARDGTLVHPRLRAVAREICPRVQTAARPPAAPRTKGGAR